MARFVRSCPGIASRFSRTVRLADHTAERLVSIVEQHATPAGYQLSQGAKPTLLHRFAEIPRDNGFDNG
jgi:hypothetical protein